MKDGVVTLEQALANAVLWAEKAKAMALEQRPDVTASGINVAILGLQRALSKVREKPPEDIGDMALRYAGQAVIPDRSKR